MERRAGSSLAATSFATLVLGGCAFGQKITYSTTIADIEASGHKSVAVATHDQRPYVVTEDKDPAFVGLSRGGYGNPFDVETPAGVPLADEISESVSRSLAERDEVVGDVALAFRMKIETRFSKEKIVAASK